MIAKGGLVVTDDSQITITLTMTKVEFHRLLQSAREMKDVHFGAVEAFVKALSNVFEEVHQHVVTRQEIE